MKGYKTYLIFGIAFIVVYLVAQYNKPTPTDWTQTFSSTDKIPFGTFILKNSLSDLFPNAKVVDSDTRLYNTLEKNFINSLYIIIAPEIKIDRVDSARLVAFLKKGNDVFIATYKLDDRLAKKFSVKLRTNFSQEPTAVNFINKNLKSTADYGFVHGIGDYYFSKIDTANAIILGTTSDGKANFIKYKIGKGSVFLMADPGFYSNVNLLDKFGAEYASKSLSYLRGSKTVIYDRFYTNPPSENTDLFGLFFKYPALKYAYYISIFSLLIFVLYNLKRRQRIIPLQDPLNNASLAFVKVIGSVYYQNRDNKDLAEKKITYFLAYLRGRYFLKTNNIEKDFSELLVQKTGIHQVQANYLTKLLLEIPKSENVTDYALIDLNQTIENFYKNTQNHGTRTV